MWGGRFDKAPDRLMRRFNDSLRFDQRLFAVDIRGSMAYARALEGAGLLTPDEREAITDGLTLVLAEFAEGRFEAQPTDEDIHTAVERRLTELIGAVGGKLHTGRSRNDQVATDLRLWMLEVIERDQAAVHTVCRALLNQAEAHSDLLMPGYTHLQPAQPILYAHWVMRFFWMLTRDHARLAECAARTAVLPLGSGALAGNPFPVDRERLAAELGFRAVSANSIDAVSDRDFAAEYLFAASLIGVHLSQLAEDVIIFSSPAYGFVQLDEAFTTGSSLMPQKRNPDSMELARGKSGRLIGDLNSLLVTLKGLPSTYNKDLQEDKEPLFDAADTLEGLLPVVAVAVETITPDVERMRTGITQGMLATDLADYLVRRGVPFRAAHHHVGQLVREAETRGVALNELPIAAYQSVSPAFEADVYAVFDAARSIAQREVPGSTGPKAVAAQLQRAHSWLGSV